ncbi:MAG TPA: glycosyltransferase 87 family protein, partial [Acidimicrobiales bacterium]|nr:glycosyltransferase 87 family protein [Acidimicrobiales bacterium]
MTGLAARVTLLREEVWGSAGRRSRVAWVAAVASVAAALAFICWIPVHSYQADINVYLWGGRNAFAPNLYSLALKRSGLGFTYTPFAAILFVPMARLLPVFPAEELWNVVNVFFLVALLHVSARATNGTITRVHALRFAMICTLPAFFLDPVFLTMGFGQINLLLVLLIVWDLAGKRGAIGSRVPQGIATGIACAIKLTPLIFVPYLLITRRTRAALTCLATFFACSIGSFIATPTASTAYWTKDAYDAKRVGGIYFISNQDLNAVLSRLLHEPVPAKLLAPLVILFGLGGLALAAWAKLRSSEMLGLLVCATAGLIVSPITWAHHLVWIVPVLVWLFIGDDRPARGTILAIGAAILFWATPIWWVPRHGLRELHEVFWQYVAGNSFFFAMVLFLFATAAMLFVRSRWRPEDGPGDELGRADGLV